MKFPEVTKPETLEKKYLGKLTKNGMAFMKVKSNFNVQALLNMDPQKRLNGA